MLQLESANQGHISRIQAVLEQALQFYLNVEGAPAGPNSALETLTMLPMNNPNPDIKHVFLVTKNGEDIGVVDLLRGHPVSDTLFLGLLLIKESHQKKGYGAEICEKIEEIAKKWQMSKIRLAVMECNGRVFPFWEKMGFHRTGETKPYIFKEIASTYVLMEKPIN